MGALSPEATFSAKREMRRLQDELKQFVFRENVSREQGDVKILIQQTSTFPSVAYRNLTLWFEVFVYFT